MKKMILFLLAFAMLLGLVGCGDDEISPSLDAEHEGTNALTKYKVTIDVECEENLIFSKYNVTVFVGYMEIGELKHGAHESFEIELEEGTHTVTFEKEGDDDVSGTAQITVSRESTYKFRIACKNDEIEVQEIETVSLTEAEMKLVTAPSLGYIVECLKHVPSIIGVEAVQDDKAADFSGLACSAGTVFFSSNLIDQEEVHGDTVHEKGTAGGGSIDVFATVSEAEERNDYLAGFDGTWLDPGSHVVVGTIVIRLSNKLSDEQRKELQNSIVEILTSGDVVEPEKYESSWTVDGSGAVVAPTESIPTTDATTAETDPTQPTGETVVTTTPTETTEPAGEWDGIQLSASDLSVRTQTDYAHTDTDIIFLGNDEGVTITIKANAPGVTKDDIAVIYDESLLSVRMEDPSASGSQTIIKIYVTGKTACKTDLVICTAYDLATYGEEATAYFLEIRKLDSSEGRVVYVTSSGEKYHFSKSCAGDNAMATTYRDATVYEYEPCGKCAK